MANITLKKNEEKRILAGHPWVYANEVQAMDKCKAGSLVTVLANDGRYIGKGYINHLSKILVRILIRNNDEPSKQLYFDRIKKANDLRVSLGYSDSYRVVFAESDNLPALIVDKYHDVLCVQFLSLAMDNAKKDIIDCLVKLFKPRAICERSDSPVREKEGLKQAKGIIYGENVQFVDIVENGIKMTVDVLNGQKTGYFLDQCDNRFALRRYVKDKNVLDCFCNSGGFSMNAVKGGAKSVTALDISELALENVRKNAQNNNFAIETLQGDVFEVLRNFKAEGKKFDVIVLDPPAFTKSADDVKNAYKGYKDINILAMKLLSEGGILVSSSCSHHMSFSMFENMLAESSKEAGKIVRTLEIKTQGADHPSCLNADETLYLKFFVLQVL